MTSPPEWVTVVCPNCAVEYRNWYRPSINLDFDEFDSEYIDSCSSAICPSCNFKVYFKQLVVRNGVFYSANATQFSESLEQRASYFSIHGGVALLRRIETPSTLWFEILNKSGTWQNGMHTGVGIMSGNFIDFDEITPAAAKEIATKLGGDLRTSN